VTMTKSYCVRGHLRSPENLNAAGACKKCTIILAERWRKANPEKYKTVLAKSQKKWRESHREYWVAHQKKRHGLSEEQYSRMLERQGGVCGVCHMPFTDEDPAVIDHKHACCPGHYSCGKCVRGLIHQSCNRGLGSFGDSAMKCRLAAEYLERF
jgi:nitrate/TMAO reductase-like tetraheme cytochrome c subunit